MLLVPGTATGFQTRRYEIKRLGCSDKVWIRNPRHRKYKPGEEADDVRKHDEEEANGEKETDGDESQRSEESDG